MNKLFLISFFTFIYFFGRSQENNLPLNFFSNKDYVIEDTLKYTYSMILDDLTYLYANYTDWVHPVEVGKSEFGLELATIRIGYEKPKKSCVFIVGNIHAREDYSSKLVMKFLNVYLLNITNQDNTYPKAKQFLDSVDIYIMPVANPDGLKIAQLDFLGIEDSFSLYRDKILLIDTYQEWKANGKGIDLNATFNDGNHHLKHGGNFHSIPCSEGYKGLFPAEPKETQAIQNFIFKIKPLITVSFHTKGNVIYWADKGTHKYFKEIDTKINKKVSIASKLALTSISKYPKIYGCGLENYIRSKYHLIASCVELDSPNGGRIQSPDNEFNIRVWNKVFLAPYIYIENAILYKKEISKIAIQ